MTVAQTTGYPLLDVMWTMVVFFGWVLWIWLLIAVFMDLFRRRDIGGGAKTLWTVFVIVLPFIGVFSYLLSQGRSMGERRAAEVEQQRAAMDDYIRTTAASSGNGDDQLAKAKSLLDSGAINQDEYEVMRRKLMTPA